jgi:hypothetical protein
MVLKLLLILCCLTPFDTSLLHKYEKQVEKFISKEFSQEEMQLDRIDFPRGELYAINQSSETKAFILVAEVAACRLGGCSSFEKINDANAAEYFDMMLLLDSEKNIINMAILDYFSEYGYEVTSKKYLKKFKGKNVCAFSTDSDGIDAVSGATVSSYALEAMISTLCDSF